ncbi:MAG: PTS sugar transporter subunit IIA [Planctomycetaceae bacterium]
MSRDYYTLEELTRQLGREAKIVEKQVSRGNIPGRRVSGEWRFNKAEITHWLEREIPGFSAADLAVLERSQNSLEVCPKSPVSSLLVLDTVEVPLNAGTRPSVLNQLVKVAARTWQVFDTNAVLEAVRQREDIFSTGFEGGVAIPHPQHRMCDALGESVIAFGRTVGGIPFGAPRRELTDLFFLVLARDDNTHLQVLARLGRLFQVPDFLSGLRSCNDSSEAHHHIIAADALLGA